MDKEFEAAVLRGMIFPRFIKKESSGKEYLKSYKKVYEGWFSLKDFYEDQFITNLAARYLFSCLDEKGKDINVLVCEERNNKMADIMQKLFHSENKKVDKIIINNRKHDNFESLKDENKICFVDNIVNSRKEVEFIENKTKNIGGKLNSYITLFNFNDEELSNPVKLIAIFNKTDIERYNINKLVFNYNYLLYKFCINK